MSTDLALAHLLPLANPTLPVGVYSDSQGLEAAVEAGTVRDTASAGRWIGDGFLRIAADRVLSDMLQGLGAKVEELQAPFEPESGAYGGGHQHHEDGGHGARIHQYGK